MGPHARTTTGGTGGDGEGSISRWMADVSNFTGVLDRTGRETVTVRVGAQGNGGHFAFDPPAIRVSRGTTVTWAWTGDGGSHDVVARDGRFESALTADPDATFEHTVETAGTCRYFCTPHRSRGMKGAVVVPAE